MLRSVNISHSQTVKEMTNFFKTDGLKAPELKLLYWITAIQYSRDYKEGMIAPIS